MKIGLIGRTNVGKSTLFKALTLEDVQIEDRPFTTIDPNKGVAYLRVKCPESEFHVKCNPHNSPCVDGVRMVPFDLIDVAGLIEGASAGKGLGNKFLSDAMEAEALIEVVDVSGKTNSSGLPAVDHYAGEDVKIVENELLTWLDSIIFKSKSRLGEDITLMVSKNLSGLGITYEHVKEIINRLKITQITEENARKISEEIITRIKPIIIACNKMDSAQNLKDTMEKLKKDFKYTFIPCSAAAELTLKEAVKHGFISYNGEDFKITGNLNDQQKNALQIIKGIIDRHGGTGIDNLLNKLVFDLMGYKVVFPVEDEKHLTDGHGRVLPDAYLVPPNSTPKDVARLIHSEIADKYKGAIDCRTNMKIRNDSSVLNGQVIKIIV